MLHAKVIVADLRKAIVTSANPTHAAYQRNIELGIVIDDVSVASQIEQHFSGLISETGTVRSSARGNPDSAYLVALVKLQNV